MVWHIEADALGAMRQALLSSATLLDECPSPASGIVPANQGELVARVAPVCELLYLMMIANGRCGPTEQEVLRGAANVLGAGQLRPHTIESLIDDFKHRHDELGPEAQLDAVAAWLSADELVAQAAFTMTVLGTSLIRTESNRMTLGPRARV